MPPFYTRSMLYTFTVLQLAFFMYQVHEEASYPFLDNLMIYNSYPIPLTCYKCTIYWFLIYSHSCAIIIIIIFRTFITLEVTKYPVTINLSSPRQLLIYFLSLSICLFWVFHISRIKNIWSSMTSFFDLMWFQDLSML